MGKDGGKNIGVCWHFQKGRCERGSSCLFSHGTAGSAAADRTNGAKGSRPRSRSRDKRAAGARSRSRDKRAARGGGSYIGGSSGLRAGDSFFHKVLDKRNDMDKLLGEERDAKRFFEAMEGFAEETDLLFRLDDRQSNGHAAVQKAFSIALASSDDDVLGCAVRFLGLLGSKKLSKGTMIECVNDLYTHIFKGPGVLRAISRALQDHRVADLSAVAWFLVSVCKTDADAREDPEVHKMAKLLQDEASASQDGGASHLATLLFPSTSVGEGIVPPTASTADGKPAEGAPASLDDARAMQAPPGGRHDNDFADYRRISVVPTPDEINCDKPSFLPLGSTQGSVPLTLDRQFRLLREDMVSTCKQQLKESMPDPRSNFRAPRIVKIVTQPRPCFLIQVDAPPGLVKRYRSLNARDKKDFFDGPGKRVLMRDSLVFFVSDGCKVCAVATVVARESQDIFVEANNSGNKHAALQVGVNFFGSAVDEMIAQSSVRSVVRIQGADRLIQSSVSYFAYAPVLKSLQSMTSIPLREELVDGTSMPLTDMPHAGLHLQDLDPKTSEVLAKDWSQVKALEMALSQRVGVIQGPPGTGKTWVGRIIVETVLTASKPNATEHQSMPKFGKQVEIRNGDPPRILVLTYTNHQLDSFCEELLDAGLGLENIVRIGASKKMSEKLKPRCIHELKQDRRFDGLQKGRYAMLKQEMKDAQAQIEVVREGLTMHSEWGGTPLTWERASTFLKNGDGEQHSAYKQLVMPSDVLGENKSGMKTVGRKGKAVAAHELWREWVGGRKMPKAIAQAKASAGEFEPGGGIWALGHDQRRQLMSEWRCEYIKPAIRSLEMAMKRFERASKQIEELRNEVLVPIIKGSRVVACTTSAAAKYAGLLRDSDIGVVVIEEAAEILEAHVLTALSENVKHLIQIGDHKQLRPKLESYSLRVESGGGVDFDKSVFERLATEVGIDGARFPTSCLGVQHRMRPEISKLVRTTMYPDLEDHPSTLHRPHVRGLQSDVVFVTHEVPEQGEEDQAGMGETRSKINVHEVQMAVETVQYLMKQGYQAKQMVVLTPYLGQLVEIRRAMSDAEFFCEMGERDQSDMKNFLKDGVEQARGAGLMGGDAVKEEKMVRVATIDNYQGEEADIVIATLVRSNDAGQIGFLREPQRVNVLLSRARIGFILIGNHRTLLKCRNPTGRRLWETVLEQMQLCEGLPVVCENHSQKTLVKSPSDFAEYAKDGGCKLACGMPLPSCPEGHLCPMRCHPLGDKPHEGVLCKVLLDAKCPNGHKVKRECWAESPQRCLVKVQDDCQLGHVRTRTCSDAPLQKCDGCDRAEERRMQREKRKMEAAEALASKRLKAEEELADVIEQSEVEKAVDKSASETRRIEEEARLVQEELARQREERSMSVKRDGENKRHCKGPVDGKGFLPYRSVAGDGVKKPADGSSAAAQSVDETCPDSATGPEALPQRERFSKRKKAQRSDLEDPMGIADLLSGRTPGAPAVEEAGQMNTDAAAREPSSWSAASSSLSAADAGEGSDDDESMHDVGESDETASAASAAAAAAHASPRNNAASRSKGESQKMQQSPPGQQLDGGFDDVKEAVAILNIKKPVYDKAYKMAGAVVKDGGGVHGHACAEAVVVLASIGLGDKPGDLKEEYEDVIRRFPMDQVDERTRATLLFVKAEMEFCDGQYLQTAARDARLFLEMPFAAETMPGWTARCKHIVENASDRNAARGSRPKANNNKSEADKWRMYKANAQGRVTDVLPEAMDDLMGMIGLERVKRDFRNELERIQLCKEQGVSADTSLYNARFDGNPGVGKTTVARLYAKFLVQLQILPDGAAILETSGPKLASEGLAELEKLLGKGKSRGGAVIFVDEAYALNPKEDRNGRQVLDFMLPVAEKLKGDYGKVVFIFAGYNKDMEKLFEHNPGLPSRFPRHFTFDDYTDDELEAILHGHLVNPNGVKPSDEQDGKKKSMAGSKPPGVLSSIKPPTAGGVNGYTGGFYSPDRAAVVPGELPHGTVKEDEWGHEWTFDAPSHTWEGDYGNQCGFGPADAGRPLGSKCNPIYSTGAGGRDGDPLLEFIYDRKLKQWQALTDDGARVKTLVYPGEPEAVLIVMPAFTLSDAKWGRIAVRRLGKMRGKMGFGNARAVKNLFDTALRRQADRITRARERGEGPDIYELRRDDLLGPRADKSKLESCEALQELMRMEGLEEVKESVRNLLGLVIKNAELEEQEKPLLEVMLNRVFLGNPGTGKTTVAKLYGRILCDFGMISKGDVILKNPSDFKGDVIGSSERNTREILHAAEGCVLVIDEAYALNPKQGNVGGLGSSDPYLTGVIDTIVECVQAVPGDDRVVVLCGYRKEMEAMVKDSNPGLARRFQLDNAFVFHDYDESSLVRILRGKAKLAGLPITVETAASAVGQLEKARSQGNFGNAGAVENLLCQAKLKMVEEKRSRLDPSDFCSEVNEDEGREEDIFADLQGCGDVIVKLEALRDMVSMAERMGQDRTNGVEFNYLFTGAPGTGKTTVARRMGRMFKSLGILPTADVVETSASDFVTGYVNQSGIKTAKIMEDAKGKVLFIDEAYQLNPEVGGGFMSEVVDEIVKALTSESLKNKMVVILAGYERDIDSMLNVNQGLRSRFSEKLHFQNIASDTAVPMLISKLRKNHGLELGFANDDPELPAPTSVLSQLALRLIDAPNFANGRDIETWAKRITQKVAARTRGQSGFAGCVVEESDCREALASLLDAKKQMAVDGVDGARKPEAQGGGGFGGARPGAACPKQQASAPPPAAQTRSSATRSVAKARTAEPEADSQSASEDLDDAEDEDAPPVDPALRPLQDILDDMGLNSEEGVRELAGLNLQSGRMQDIARNLAGKLNTTVGVATEFLKGWQVSQRKMLEKLEQQETDAASGKQKLQAIWRCAVCGRDDKPFVVCWVSPYIVRYTPVKA